MSYKPERALTLCFANLLFLQNLSKVEMSYKPERALTLLFSYSYRILSFTVEMSYKPERALTQEYLPLADLNLLVEMSYKPERALTQYRYVTQIFQELSK